MYIFATRMRCTFQIFITYRWKLAPKLTAPKDAWFVCDCLSFLFHTSSVLLFLVLHNHFRPAEANVCLVCDVIISLQNITLYNWEYFTTIFYISMNLLDIFLAYFVLFLQFHFSHSWCSFQWPLLIHSFLPMFMWFFCTYCHTFTYTKVSIGFKTKTLLIVD